MAKEVQLSKVALQFLEDVAAHGALGVTSHGLSGLAPRQVDRERQKVRRIGFAVFSHGRWFVQPAGRDYLALNKATGETQ